MTPRLFESLWTTEARHIYHFEFDESRSGSLDVVRTERKDTIKPTGGFRNSFLKIQDVPLVTESRISLIILPLMRILQRNIKRTYLIV
jgi:hypothetical protein